MRKGFSLVMVVVIVLGTFTLKIYGADTIEDTDYEYLDINLRPSGADCILNYGDDILVAGYLESPGFGNTGEVILYDKNLNIKWRTAVDDALWDIKIYDGYVYGWGNTSLYKLDNLGNIVWKVDLDEIVPVKYNHFHPDAMVAFEGSIVLKGHFYNQEIDEFGVVDVNPQTGKMQTFLTGFTYDSSSTHNAYDLRFDGDKLIINAEFTGDYGKFYSYSNKTLSEVSKSVYDNATWTDFERRNKTFLSSDWEDVNGEYVFTGYTVSGTDIKFMHQNGIHFTVAVLNNNDILTYTYYDTDQGQESKFTIIHSGTGSLSSIAEEYSESTLIVDYESISLGASPSTVESEVTGFIDLIDLRDLENPYNVEEITDFIEHGISASSYSELEVINDQVMIDYDKVVPGQDIAVYVKETLESRLNEKTIDVNRELETDLILDAPMTGDSIDIRIDESVNKILADSVTVDTGNVAVTLDQAALSTELDGTLVVNISRKSSSHARRALGTVASLEPGFVVNDTGRIITLADLQLFEDVEVYEVKFIKDGKVIDKTDSKITISLDMVSGEPDYNSVFIEKEDGTREAIGGNYNKTTSKLEIKTSTSGKFLIKENKKSFDDLDGLDAATKKAIEVLAAKGMINGKSTTSFDPSGTITRAEFTKIIIRALYLTDSGAVNDFKDVADTSWYKTYVASSKQAGLINGYTDGTFKPLNVITKQEMVKICSASLHEQKGYFYPANQDLYIGRYSDTVANWVQPYVALAEREGIIVNSSAGIFEGGNGITRADAAIMLYRLFKRL